MLNGLSEVYKVKKRVTRSISPENFKGEKGKGGMATEGTGAHPARELGVGWKVSPSVVVKPGEKFIMAEIDGPGVITHIWCTCFPDKWRSTQLRVYWDDEENPSIQTPLGDFFCNGWNVRSTLSSIPVAVNPAGGFNCYWPMPFRKKARIEIINTHFEDLVIYYQVTYELGEVDEDAAYLHAKWNRSNPLKYKEVHTILDGVKGRGQYVGTYIAWQVNNNNWWGEGEIKFYMDGDKEFPTICGTGTEDYFGGAWDFQGKDGYEKYTTPYLGLSQIILPDGKYKPQTRFGMYRWHVLDPIRFEEDLRVTIQALGWRSNARYLPLQDDIASVAFWYQLEPHNHFEISDNPDDYEVI